MKDDFKGFGFNPKESGNHFLVVIPAGRDADALVSIYERFHWDSEGEQQIDKKDVLKLQISRHKWSKVTRTVASEFNSRLKQEGKPAGRFIQGGVPLDKLLGKELMVLLWAIENNDPTGIPVALRNWLGLLPEERWWLYTITNASTGTINDSRRGWRMALRYALCENPVEEKPYRQVSINETMGGDS